MTTGPTTRRRFLAALAATAAAACRTGSPGGSLAVFAAMSLADVLPDLAAAFAAEPGGRPVEPVLAGSQILRLQIERGAPADVFLSADGTHVDALEAAGLVARRRVFATNGIAAAVPAASPLRHLADLTRADRIALGTKAVPVGAAARRLLAAADAHLGPGFADAVLARVVSLLPDVRRIRLAVARGAVDAGFVYATCVHAEPRLRALRLPEGLREDTELHAAVLAGRPEGRRRTAEHFLAFLAGDRARRVLARAGFGAPKAP